MTGQYNPFQRQNGLQQGQIGAAGAGQFSSPAGMVTPPMTTPGGGAGMQTVQAPAVQPQRQGGGVGLGQALGGMQGLLGMMGGSQASGAGAGGQAGQEGQFGTVAKGVLGGATNGAMAGSMFGPWGTAIGGIAGGLLGGLSGGGLFGGGSK